MVPDQISYFPECCFALTDTEVYIVYIFTSGKIDLTLNALIASCERGGSI